MEGRSKQKEWYSRAWLIAAASAADFSYRIVADDEVGVDMTVHRDHHTLDFQLKATSHPEIQDGCLIHDLDVRTYNLLRQPTRSAGAVLAVVVVGDDTAGWLVMDDHGTRLDRSAYFLSIIGLPETANEATVRLKLPTANLLTADAIAGLMDDEAARWSS